METPMQSAQDVHVILQAGGEGRRIRFAEGASPKPMLTVGGMPMIERLLSQFIDSGFRRFTVVTGFRGSIIEEHLTHLTAVPRDIELTFYHEATPLGNAGALG